MSVKLDGSISYKYGVFYTDGGYRERLSGVGGGAGIHGYLFNELTSVRHPKVPQLITPLGYTKKMSGAELKDEKYDPEYTAWDFTINAKDGGISKGDDIKIVDAWICLPEDKAQRGELEAFIRLIRNEDIVCEKYVIHSDSAYLVDGINKHLKTWKTNNWARADHTPIKNPDLWEKIDGILTERGDDIRLLKIKAHAGHYGNECADRNATYAVAASINKHNFSEWIITDVSDASYWEPVKSIPTLLQQKWCYSLSETARLKSVINGEEYTHYFMGDHNSSKDDIELLGKKMSDAGFSLVLHKEPAPLIDEIKQYHVENMWDHKCNMYKSELMTMVNIANITKPKLVWECNNVGRECMFISSDHNDLISTTDDLVSKVVRPPRLSYRVLDIENIYKDVLYTYMAKQGHDIDEPTTYTKMNIVVNDVTDLFYEHAVTKSGTQGACKLTDYYGLVTTNIKMDVEHPCGDKKARVVLGRGIDLPSRSIMSKIAPLNPKVSVVTWLFDTIMFNYGFIIECDAGVAIWSGYASTRILSTKEQD